MLFLAGSEMLKAFPEVVVWVAGVVCGELKGMYTGILFQGPRQPTLRMRLLNAVSMLGATYRSEEKLFGSWAER